MSDAIYNVPPEIALPTAVNPLIFNGEKLIPAWTRVFSKRANLHVFLQFISAPRLRRNRSLASSRSTRR